MAKFFVHKSVFESGERFPIVLETETLLPAVLATRYIVDERRETKQASTLERDVRVLAWFYEWCSNAKLDLEGRLRSGELISSREIQGFVRWLRAGRHHKIVGTIGKVENEAGGHAVVLQPSTFNVYLSVVESFLIWAAYEFIPRRYPAEGVKKSLRGAKRRIERAFKAYRAIGSVERAKRYGLSRSEVQELRSIAEPGSPRNPFWPKNQIRNQLIIETMIATGVRAGELLKIRLQDLPRGPKQTLSVVRQPDDPLDPRQDEPRVKTRSREIPLPKELAVNLVRYVQTVRRNCNHQYLFVSSRGNAPLSRAGLWNIFRTLRKCFRSDDRFHPHLLRHTFNDLLMEKAKGSDLTDDMVVKIQNFLNGWSEGSTQSEVYTRRFVEAEALELVGRYQEMLWRGMPDE